MRTLKIKYNGLKCYHCEKMMTCEFEKRLDVILNILKMPEFVSDYPISIDLIQAIYNYCKFFIEVDKNEK
jgi:hypothetical protein